VVSSGGGDLRLELGKAGAVQVAAAPAPAVAAPPPAVASADQVATRVETTEFRMGMQPIRTDGQIRAHQIKEGASLPRLQQAGLRPGDIITRVNGSMLNEEQLMELSWTMTNSERTEFEVIRGGKPVKLVYQPNAIRQ
jgi:type II secretory pathway component PulC